MHSSADDEHIRKECQKLGVEHRLIKPVKMHDLYDALSMATTKKVTSPALSSTIQGKVFDKKINVLLVEDSSVNMLLARTILNRITPNATVLEAQNGQEAVLACKVKQPDLILMDVQMPILNGYEATQKIRAMHPNSRIPIIALTAGNVKGEKERCIASGMDDFLAKPFVENDLHHIIEKWLGLSPTAIGATQLTSHQSEDVHFDLKKLTANLGSDKDSIHFILNLAKDEISKNIEEIKQHAATNNIIILKQVARKLYGLSLSTNLNILANHSRALEYMQDGDNVALLVKNIINESDVILRILAEAHHELDNS